MIDWPYFFASIGVIVMVIAGAGLFFTGLHAVCTP